MHICIESEQALLTADEPPQFQGKNAEGRDPLLQILTEG
jgi:hypothetical protein